MTDNGRNNAHQTPIAWDEQGLPRSSLYDDVYFSVSGGLEESRHIFLANNRLSERWQALSENDHFTVAETGFGTGKNFLCCWQLWRQQAPSNARLHFISTEKHPLGRDDLKRTFSLWPELEPLAQALLHQYPAAWTGIHRLIFDEGRVCLTLCLGDALESLEQLQASVDCWFLDGFAPARNPDIWQPALYMRMSQLSNPNATFSTYTVAGMARRGLVAAGFHVEVAEGCGLKREMLRGFLPRPVESVPSGSPWQYPANSNLGGREIVVVGAGLAGASCAYALARRGWKVRVLEQHSEPAQEASGNPQGVLYTKLSAQGTLLSELVHQGYHFSLALLRQLLPPDQHPLAWSPCGMVQLAYNDKELKRQQQLLNSNLAHPQFFQALNAGQLSDKAGVEVGVGGLYYPNAGWVNPASLCQALLSHPAITLTTHWPLTSLEAINPGSGWRLSNDRGDSLDSSRVILTTGRDCHSLPQSQYLPLKSIRGQISYLASGTSNSDSSCGQLPRTVLCGEGYIAPPRLGQVNVGATFNFDSDLRECRDQDHEFNLDLLHRLSPELHQYLNASLPNITGGRANFRTTSPDYLPLVGALVDESAFLETYSRLRKDAKTQFDTPCPYLPGLYVSTAHGSRGLVTCPLAGEMLASEICNEPLPVSLKLHQNLSPNRFLVRQLIRNRI
ncbi:bifunctional tRNA (5-methylaminomethyl-2-thiouridine)(34)-methyltransferase MnmD/FAD-dependent 5-carboxymethylaminomethyl-2-thiouridine(34) oxidoreductase MnmC [Aestuariirhabdus sp. Z084]|uniref:bifunctional tRNA (5-methylaminomethyl-2-thiouridine)(34)-methyltransferase MnmD/FAD-dependent 5-carboxymethylaminomethyl-2-thiouridine(34) oxidoreductase MnmC n=1 Tax=Aestuariirhabdus haliotis TaxID=2918751 RepID=UPI00201B3990|nr:bifunctional tRNA (5-methylaminomethyl-2-thiouridine)(34)-methyltransferase MnmD/FAD-dependent 5-carboxymethylaminomethyl-2-thiouridine(34) oxidoreductase MnmC [Aestuariirhabdus haliotis]MCL6415559.1 bifunctional tRNA (5-methylaminomethyl-2-thiouridine)(34)-methyltransferase MnmD/FAD-dependent 5-carboxymethylaminomethyl-2-thiouridine(34) oxidoreductase MnmC [Aestuariirhabdus haliotis]MCL6419236.1 bifunctional tRNA (5-methylaminomethyl-2-thiouridine)(34)-methyltransferase MnmD/FAD-dependent 5-c